MTNCEYQEIKQEFKKALLKNLKSFLVSRERREDWISSCTPMNKTNWSTLTDSLPDHILVSDIDDLIEDYETKHGKIDLT